VDPLILSLWLIRLAFLALLYLFLFSVVRVLLRDIRQAAREPSTELGRLIVAASPSGEPPSGSVFPLDAVTSIGRDVNNSVVVEDDFVSGEHCLLTFRGRAWYVEDLGSTNGTYVNGDRVDGIAALGFGDELQVGNARLRLERSHR